MFSRSFFSTNQEVFFDRSSDLYFYNKANLPKTQLFSRKYSVIHAQPKVTQKQQFIKTYCEFFIRLFSMHCQNNLSPSALKRVVDQKLDEVGQEAIGQCFKRCFGEIEGSLSPMEEVVCWLEAGITPSTDALNTALANSKSMGAIKVLIRFGAEVKSSTIALAIRKGFSEEEVKYLAERTQEKLTGDVLQSAIRSKMKLVQFFVTKGAVVSEEALMACLETKHELKVFEYLLNAYVKQESFEHVDLQLKLDAFLNHAIRLKSSQEIIQFLFNKGAKVSSNTVESAIRARASIGFIKTLVDSLQQSAEAPAYTLFFKLAIQAGYSEDDLKQFYAFGAHVTVSTLNEVFSSEQTKQNAELLRVVTHFLKYAIPTEETLNLAIGSLFPDSQTGAILIELLKAGAVPSMASVQLAQKRGYSWDWVRGHLFTDEMKPTLEMFEKEVHQTRPDLQFVKKCIQAGLRATIDLVDHAVKGYAPRPERVELVNMLLRAMKEGSHPNPSAMEAALKQRYPHETIVAFLNTNIKEVFMPGQLDLALRLAIQCQYGSDTIDAIITKWGLNPSYDTLGAAYFRSDSAITRLVERQQDRCFHKSVFRVQPKQPWVDASLFF